MTRLERIAAYRRNQPLAELERKWAKARGRYSKNFWAIEWLDLNIVYAAKLGITLLPPKGHV